MKRIIFLVGIGFLTACSAGEAELQKSLLEEIREEYLLDEVTFFKNELDFPAIIPHSPAWTEPLFPPTGIIATNSFVIKKTTGLSTASYPLVFQIFSNNVNVAYGKLYEYPSFELACDAFIVPIIDNNRGAGIAQEYQILTAGVGDFRINTKEEIYLKFFGFHFVRGGKAISLYPIINDDNTNLQLIAETLDALLKNPPAK